MLSFFHSLKLIHAVRQSGVGVRELERMRGFEPGFEKKPASILIFRWVSFLLFAGLFAGIGCIGLMSVGLMSSVEAHAEPFTLQVGTDYRVLPSPAPASSDRVDVILFFNYADPATLAIIKEWAAWQKDASENLRLTMYPMVSQDTDGFAARLFFALNILHREDLTLTAATALSSGLITLDSPLSWSQWLMGQGVSNETISEAINSSLVIAKTASIPQTLALYGVNESPTVVINGRFIIDGAPSTLISRTKSLTSRILELLESSS